MPLLDEAAELLIRDDRTARTRRARERAHRIAYATEALTLTGDSGDDVLTAADLLDAGELAARQER